MKAILSETGITIKPESVAEQLALRYLFLDGEDIFQKVLIDNILDMPGIMPGLSGRLSEGPVDCDMIRFPFRPEADR